jgi:hypothetical protein
MEFFSQKMSFWGYVMLIFTVCHSFYQNFITSYSLCLNLMAKKMVSKVRGKSLSKEYFGFLHLAKKLQCIFQIKNEDFKIFPTVLESYSTSFKQKNQRKIYSKSRRE